MKRVAFSLVLLCLASSVIPAEAWGGMGYVMASGVMEGLPGDSLPLNALLRAHGYGEFSPFTFGMGGGGGAFIGSVYIGGWGVGEGLFAESKGPDGKILSRMSGYGGVEVGVPLSLGQVIFMPVGTIGAGGTDIELIDPPSGSASFDDLLDDPGVGVRLTSSEIRVGAGLHFLWMPGVAGFLIKAYYFYVPYQSWSIMGPGEYTYPVEGVPSSSPHRFFLGVGVVFGGVFSERGKVNDRGWAEWEEE
ncbi:hypothetical protein Spith_0286 [Spirochaeta thermophila DSM 6578]|uniref:Outer membrane protein beta-barrel domain-containing protein n=1 Tax=Winmispira thermophila (strain ATCC 700085 / DSM 6578 / Z-1203) TaxID=869211 RepID=G0GDE6_WINT7|nr:hypothetical protein [Spirochaeta thermophila]AEJ60572.1 hypothetical protein Spith_0286 [Spirochaeta thermophila DSM 6578]